MSKTVHVELGYRSYDILVGSGILKDSAAYIKPHLRSSKVIIVTDENVAPLHLSRLEQSLSAEKIEISSIILPAGEATKSYSQLEELLDEILAQKPDRDITLIAFGGGVVGDITGFAASILLRGVDFIQIPTTLLAMVDSSVGGKTGINTQFGKNLIGNFYQPKIVIADAELLLTLPKRELLAGYAEAFKYALINDAEFFETLEEYRDIWGDFNEKTSSLDIASDIVIKSCQSKAAIVAEDERESGVRALLNLGHSFGHALEAELGYDGRLLHGEAVAMGMVMAFEFSHQLNLCSKDDVKKVRQHLANIGLPVNLKNIDYNFSADSLINHMKHDKKNKGNKLVLILVDGIGKAFIEKNVDMDEVYNFLKMRIL